MDSGLAQGLIGIVGVYIVGWIAKKIPNKYLQKFFGGIGLTVCAPLMILGRTIEEFFNGINGYEALSGKN